MITPKNVNKLMTFVQTKLPIWTKKKKLIIDALVCSLFLVLGGTASFFCWRNAVRNS
jgi:hypothetical protein